MSNWPPNRRTPAWTSGRRVTTAASLQRYFVEKLSLPSTTASYLRNSAAAFAAVSASGYTSTARSGRNARSVAAAESAFHCPTTIVPVDHLAVEVGDVDTVVVDHPDPSDSRGGEIQEDGRSQSSRADDERGRPEESLLPGLPQFLDEDVPAVAQRVFA